ncbi:MAG: hypothetical protein IKG42_01865 [Clostridia bacterium]|nr:hypothetical protein [Clostridia bacterium]
MKEKKELVDDKFNKVIKKMLNLLKVNAISNSALQLKNSEDIILQKLENEKNSLEFGINLINKNVLKNQKRYSDVFDEIEELLERYKELLYKASRYYDNIIFFENVKILKEELFQLEQSNQINSLRMDENKAKEKLDNSDDEIAEKIYAIEEEISKSETKVKRTKTLLRNKIKEKEDALFYAIETKEKEIQREIKGPRVIKNATRFFMGKLNPVKMIERNVFSGLKVRIDEFERDSEEIFSKKLKYTEENILSIIDELVKKTEKRILK